MKARAWRSSLRSSELYQTFTPYIRLEVIVFYGFTFFHKLNADFLDPSSSCAVTFLGHMIDLFSLPSLPALESLAIWVTLGVECLLPIGLAIPRLWLPAVLLGAGFHCVLALDVIKMFYNFSAVMVALLWVFVPLSAAAPLVRAHQRLRRAVRGKPVSALAWYGSFSIGFTSFLGYVLTLVLCWQFPELSLGLNVIGFSLLWLVLSGTLFVTVGYAWRQLRERAGDRSPRLCRKTSPLLLIPLLVFLNGLGPYLGLKLRSAWQMYSNLSVDDLGSNHFLIPRSLDIGGFLADSVVIVSTSDSLLNERYVQTDFRMPYFALRSYLAHRPEVRLAYVQSGQYREIARAGDSPEFSSRPHPLLRKLLTFRPLGQQAGRICDW